MAAAGIGLWHAGVGWQVTYTDVYRNIEASQQKVSPGTALYDQLNKELARDVETARRGWDMGAAGLGLLYCGLGFVIVSVVLTVVATDRQSHRKQLQKMAEQFRQALTSIERRVSDRRQGPDPGYVGEERRKEVRRKTERTNEASINTDDT